MPIMTPQERHFAADLAAAADKHQREVDRLRSQLRDRDAALNAVNDALAVRDGLRRCCLQVYVSHRSNTFFAHVLHPCLHRTCERGRRLLPG
jgi:hypothetical protein